MLLEKVFILCCLCRYLIDARWFKQWKKYVGFDDWDMVGETAANPGPIDNSMLFKGMAIFCTSY